MSQFADDFAASAGAAMLAYQGDSITRITSGGASSTVTAIISDENMGGDEVETESGLVRIRIKSLQVAANQATSVDDRWTIGGEQWACTGVTGGHDGLKVVTVKRTDRVASQSSARRGG